MLVCSALLLAALLAACSPPPPGGRPALPPAAQPEVPAPRVFLVDDAPGADDRARINHALNAAGAVEGPKIVRFSAREYLVRPAELDSFAPVLGASGLRDLTLEGQGAVLVAQDALDCRKGYFFKISKFENVAVRDLVLTYRPAPLLQGRIVHADQPGHRVRVALDPRFAAPGQLRQTPFSQLWCRVGRVENARWPKPANPSWMEVGVDASGGLRATPEADGTFTLEAGRIAMDQTLNARQNWAEGDPFVVWKRAGQDGFCFEEGRGLRLYNIRVESALHYAIKLRGVLGATVARCQVVPADGAMLSSSADGIDVQQSKQVAIEDCTLVATGDDAISLLNHGHGDNGTWFEKRFPAPYPNTNEEVELRRNHIEGGNRNGILLLASWAVVADNTVWHTRQYGLKFTGHHTRIENNRFREVGSFAAYRHILDELDTGIICSDEWVQRHAVIRYNRLEDWYNMPGLLLKSVEQARVYGNTFVLRDADRAAAKPFNSYLSSLKGIVVTTGASGGSTNGCREMLVRDNVFHAPGAWASVADALAMQGAHDRVVAEENRLAGAAP